MANMTPEYVCDMYFSYLVHFVKRNTVEGYTMIELFRYLHSREFTWCFPHDENRAKDGTDLRRRFYLDCPEFKDYVHFLDGPCSVFEMMVGLALRTEETLMANPAYGDRTKHWFNVMSSSMGLRAPYAIDRSFDIDYVENCVDRCLNREYDADGTGGFFRVRDFDGDMRDMEIWSQLHAFLNARYN